MDPTMDSTKHILNYLMPILWRESPRLHGFMQRCLPACCPLGAGRRRWRVLRVGPAHWRLPLHCGCRAEVGTIFALSWLITWFGHVLANAQHVLRLYDFFLASHPLMAVYFAAAVRPRRPEAAAAAAAAANSCGRGSGCPHCWAGPPL